MSHIPELFVVVCIISILICLATPKTKTHDLINVGSFQTFLFALDLNFYSQIPNTNIQKLMLIERFDTRPYHQANQRTSGPENAHLKPDPGVLSHHEMTLTLKTHTPLLNS